MIFFQPNLKSSQIVCKSIEIQEVTKIYYNSFWETIEVYIQKIQKYDKC